MPRQSSNSVTVFFPHLSREELLAELRLRLRSLQDALPVERAVLFGSWASGRATAFSDIDLLVIYAGPARHEAFRTVRQHIRLRGLEAHVYSEDEAAALTSIIDRMTAGGVELCANHPVAERAGGGRG